MHGMDSSDPRKIKCASNLLSDRESVPYLLDNCNKRLYFESCFGFETSNLKQRGVHCIEYLVGERQISNNNSIVNFYTCLDDVIEKVHRKCRKPLKNWQISCE